MKLKEYKKVINECKNDITNIYIYNCLMNDDRMTKDFVEDDLKMESLILIVYNTYLTGQKIYPLEFICEVAITYLEEIFKYKPEEVAEELDCLCSETYYNC